MQYSAPLHRYNTVSALVFSPIIMNNAAINNCVYTPWAHIKENYWVWVSISSMFLDIAQLLDKMIYQCIILHGMYQSRKFSECTVISQWCFNLYFTDCYCYWASLKILIDYLIFFYLNYSFFLLLFFFLYHILDTNSFIFIYITITKCLSQSVTCVTTLLLFVVGWGRKGFFGFVLTE